MLKIFLVEDSAPVRKRMAVLFGSIEGAAIAGEAEEPEGALAGIAASHADVVIIDLRLTDSSGLDVLAALTQRDRSVITMVLTNHSGASFRQACMAAGAGYFFDKTGEFGLARNTIEQIARERLAGTHR
jgi:two-component system response regulator DevR